MKKFTQVIGAIHEAEAAEKSELQKSYTEYFKAKLNKFGVKSPAELSAEKKSEFFTEISKDWDRGQGATKTGQADVEKHGVKESLDLNEAESTPSALAAFIEKNVKHFAAFLKPKSITATVNGEIVIIKPGSGSFTITVDFGKSTIDSTGKPAHPESTSYVELMSYIKGQTKFNVLHESVEVNEGTKFTQTEMVSSMTSRNQVPGYGATWEVIKKLPGDKWLCVCIKEGGKYFKGEKLEWSTNYINGCAREAGDKDPIHEANDSMIFVLHKGKQLAVEPEDVAAFKAGKNVYATDEDGKEYEVNKNTSDPLKESRVVLDTTNPDHEALDKFIHEHSIIVKELQSGSKNYEFTGDKKDLSEMIQKFWGDKELINKISESTANEGNAFGDAVKKAKEAGEKEFEFQGKTYKVEESDENLDEAEIKSEADFKEYATKILKKAHPDDYDEKKAEATIAGILKKANGDFGMAVGIIGASLG